MKLKFFPSRSALSVIRLCILVVLLAICLMYVFAIYKLKNSSLTGAAGGFMAAMDTEQRVNHRILTHKEMSNWRKGPSRAA